MARLSIPLEANRSRLRACATAAVCWLEGWIGGPCCHAIPAAPGPQVHTRGRHLTVPATTSSSSVVSLVRKGQSLLKLLSRRRQPFACRPRPQHARSQRCATILAPARNRQQAHAAPLARYLANPVWSYGAYFSRNSTHKTQHQTMTCVDDLLLLFFSRESSGASSIGRVKKDGTARSIAAQHQLMSSTQLQFPIAVQFPSSQQQHLPPAQHHPPWPPHPAGALTDHYPPNQKLDRRTACLMMPCKQHEASNIAC